MVLDSRSWRLAGKVITIAHEGGHALVSVLSGRRLDGIRLHSDSSGVTYSRGKRTGPGLVLTAAAGYVMPSLLGAGAAWLLAERHLTAMLWLALVLLAATFLAIRNLFGALAVLVTAGGVFVVSYYASAAVQAGFAYLAVWFLLFGGAAPGGRAGPRLVGVCGRFEVFGSTPAVDQGLRRRAAGPADRRPGRPVDLAVRAGRAGRPHRRRRPARAARRFPGVAAPVGPAPPRLVR